MRSLVVTAAEVASTPIYREMLSRFPQGSKPEDLEWRYDWVMMNPKLNVRDAMAAQCRGKPYVPRARAEDAMVTLVVTLKGGFVKRQVVSTFPMAVRREIERYL